MNQEVNPEYNTNTGISGLVFIEKKTYLDERGWFIEVLRLDELEKNTGIMFDFRQWSHSLSLPGTIRAFHIEEQTKIVLPITGKMLSYYVDLRPDSDTWMKIVKVEFSDPNYRAVVIPPGVANSICVTGNISVHYMYLIDAYYSKEKTRGVAWNDPDIGVKWSIKKPIISERDMNNPKLRELFPEKFK